MVPTVLLTFLYRSGLEDLRGRSGSDRSGARILIRVSLFLRWTC
ncbi:MAG TPA: hypothetical protein VE981_06010 [Planctomycetota bacterium]|nr:hypothetical protein [Planctomycetota bacterium]